MDTGIRILAEQDINIVSATKQTQYGAQGSSEDGRKFRYVGFSGTATVMPGLLVVATPVTANYQGLAITAVGTGGQTTANLAGSQTSTSVIVLTNGATAITADQFAEGTLEVLIGAAGVTGSYTYRIRGNTAAAANTGFVTLFLASNLRHTTALVAGVDNANLNVSVFSSVGISATADVPIGVTVMPVPNTASVTNYGWVQTSGPLNVKNDAAGTIAVGTAIGQSVSVAGSVRQATASTSPLIGTTHTAILASTSGPVFLNIS